FGAADDGIGRCLDDGCHAVGNLLGRDIEIANYAEVLTFDKAVEPQFVEHRADRHRRSRRRHQDAETVIAAGILRASRQWQGGCAAKSRDELAPVHVTSHHSCGRWPDCMYYIAPR